MTDTFPTSDQVARAIIAACRETGADPLDVACGEADDGRGGAKGARPIGRARAYAAMALRSACRCGPVAISRMVGAGTPASYLTIISGKVAHDELGWWSEAAFERVRGRPAEPEEPGPPPRPEPAQARPAGPPPRPSAPGKRQLLEDFAQAVRNTAAMPTR